MDLGTAGRVVVIGACSPSYDVGMPVPHHVPGLVDVATKAGVSLSTVSRVISGRTPVSQELRARVMAAVEELEYRPNAAAQSLVSGRRSTIAVLARNTSRFGYALTLQGIEEAARSAGYVVMITVIESAEPGELSTAIDLVLSQPLAGAVVVEFDDVGVATLAALPEYLPVVAVAGARKPAGQRPHVFLDDFEGGFQAARYLLSLGHSTVHHLAIPATSVRSGREWGWRQALTDAGLTPPGVVRAGYSPTSGYDAAQQLVGKPEVTAILCGNDELAIGAMRAYQEQGRSIPGDVSIVGFDDQAFAPMWHPSLTTVSQDFAGLGQRAFALLQGWLETGTRPDDINMSAHLVVRESSAAPR